MMQKIDDLKEKRSGVPKQNTGLNPDTINKSHTTATSVNQMMAAGTQRVELIARNFAEGVKDIFKNILTILCEYQDQERIIRLRGKFIPMNPRSWHRQSRSTFTSFTRCFRSARKINTKWWNGFS